MFSETIIKQGPKYFCLTKGNIARLLSISYVMSWLPSRIWSNRK